MRCIMQLGLSPGARYHLQRIVNTREADAAAKHAPGSVADLEKYAEGTASQLLILQVGSGVSNALVPQSTSGCHTNSHPALGRPKHVPSDTGSQTLTMRGRAVQGVCRRQHRG